MGGGDSTDGQEHPKGPSGRPHIASPSCTFSPRSSRHSWEGGVVVPVFQMVTMMATDTHRALVMGQVLRESLVLVLVTSLLSKSEEPSRSTCPGPFSDFLQHGN